jgi:hypothetical protein
LKIQPLIRRAGEQAESAGEQAEGAKVNTKDAHALTEGAGKESHSLTAV